MAIIEIDGIVAAVDLAYRDTAIAVDAAFTAAIEGDYYEHPGLTKRLNGTTVGSPRNLVDRGDLRNSQSMTAIGPGEMEFAWMAPHAAVNYFGRRLVSGKLIPPKPWVEQAIAGDSTAPIEYQRADALLNVPASLGERIRANLAALSDA
jgi:hypothetical protein